MFCYITSASWDKVCINGCLPVRRKMFVSFFSSINARWVSRFTSCAADVPLLSFIYTHPTCHCPCIPAGAIGSSRSGVSIDGNATFTSNSASDGGEKGRPRSSLGTLYISLLHTVVLPDRNTLLWPCFPLRKPNIMQTGPFFCSIIQHHH